MWPEEFQHSRSLNLVLRFGIAILVLAFYVTAVLHYSYTPDDTYIYLQYARNIAEGNGFSFNIGEPSYGVPGPLWALLIAAGAAGGLDPFVVAKTIDLFFAGLSVIIALRLSVEILKDPLYALVATAVVATDTWLLRWAGSGLETSLSVLLVLLTFFYVYRTEYALASLSAAFLTLVRPEGALLFVLVQADNVINTSNWRLAFRVTLKSTGVYAAVLAPWMVYALLTFGKVIPNTFDAQTISGYSLESLIGVLGSEVKILLISQGISIALLLIGVAGVLRRSSLRHAWIEVFPLVWPLALLLFYSIMNVQVVSRYLLLVSPVIAIFGVWGVKKSTEFWKLRWRTSLGLLAGLVMISGVQNQVFYHLKVLPHLKGFILGMEECLRPMGYELRKMGGPTTSVLTSDIGLVGYVSGVKVYDTAGILSPEIRKQFSGLTYDDGMEQEVYLNVIRPDFVLDRSHQPGRLETAELKKIMSCRFPSLGLMFESQVYYTLYKRGSS
ncbi:MAG: hypothetical protein WEF53_14085 [Bacteroidota bacterium]